MKRSKKGIQAKNSTEFTDLIDICIELGIKGYRCHPYSSWEKGSVEVHNRYIRRYIPKGSNIKDYDKEYIEDITRKIHGYKTPEEIFYGKTGYLPKKCVSNKAGKVLKRI